MINIKKIYAYIFFLVLTVTGFTGCAGEQPMKETQQFSCCVEYNGRVINGFADTDTDWYLFLPSDFAVQDINVNYTGDIARCSRGVFDSENSAVMQPFEKNGDSFTITGTDGIIRTVTLMQSELPAVEISLTGLTVEDIHRDKNLRAYRTSVNITDKNNSANNLTLSGNVRLKGRGNSSWTEYDKKGYQITMPYPMPVMGMASGEKWLLLANSSDDSMLRNAVAFSLADMMDMPFSPDFRYVDLWIDGDYLGTYMMCEKITVESTRMGLSHRDGALFEYDQAFWEEEENSFFNNSLQSYFTLKETVSDRENTFPVIIETFDSAVDSLMEYLYSTPSAQITLESLSQYIDVESFAKYYIINEYLLNKESFGTSFYWYQDGSGDVLHLGPVWDFDTAMGVDDTDVSVKYGYNHPVFLYLVSAPRIRDYLNQLYTDYSSEISSLAVYAQTMAEKIKSSARMNYTRWHTLGSKNVKNTSLFMASTYDEAVTNLTDWLTARYSLFTVPYINTLSSTISEDYRTLNVSFRDVGYTDVHIVVHHSESDEVMTDMYPAYCENGIWRAEIDMSYYNRSGLYNVNAVSGGVTVAAGRNYIPQESGSDYSLSAQLSADGTAIIMSFTDGMLCSNVVFTIRNGDDYGDDEKHLQGYRDENGVWQHTASREYFPSSGTYIIKAYSVENDVFTRRGAVSVEVVHGTDYPVTAVVSEDAQTMTISVPDVYNRQGVLFAVWSHANSQDDIQWLTAHKTADGRWEAVADMTAFNDTGLFPIHVFEQSGTSEKLYLNDGSVSYIESRNPDGYPVSASLRRDKTSLSISLSPSAECGPVTFAVWSDAGAQADLQWFDAVQENGVWKATVNLAEYSEKGTYHIHAYEKVDGVLTALLQTTTTEI